MVTAVISRVVMEPPSSLPKGRTVYRCTNVGCRLPNKVPGIDRENRTAPVFVFCNTLFSPGATEDSQGEGCENLAHVDAT